MRIYSRYYHTSNVLLFFGDELKAVAIQPTFDIRSCGLPRPPLHYPLIRLNSIVAEDDLEATQKFIADERRWDSLVHYRVITNEIGEREFFVAVIEDDGRVRFAPTNIRERTEW